MSAQEPPAAPCVVRRDAPRRQPSTRGRLGLLDLATERSTLVRRFSEKVDSLDWSPDGSRLLMVMGTRNGHNRLAIVDAGDPTSRPIRIALPRRVDSKVDIDRAVWSPDGRRIALSAYHSGGGYYRSSVWSWTPTDTTSDAS
jgi:Tol biopolymer transport system component